MVPLVSGGALRGLSDFLHSRGITSWQGHASRCRRCLHGAIRAHVGVFPNPAAAWSPASVGSWPRRDQAEGESYKNCLGLSCLKVFEFELNCRHIQGSLCAHTLSWYWGAQMLRGTDYSSSRFFMKWLSFVSFSGLFPCPYMVG